MSAERKEIVSKPPLTPEESAAIVVRAEAIRKKALAEGKIEEWDIDRVNAELGRDRRTECHEALNEGAHDGSHPRNAAYSHGMSVETGVRKPPLTAEEKKAIVDRAMEIKRKAMAEGKIEFWDYDRINAELGRNRPES